MYLQKSIMTGYGIEAQIWSIRKIEISGTKATVDLSLYASVEALTNNKQILDNCKIIISNINLSQPLEHQIYAKAMESRLDSENEEQNFYTTSHSGTVFFQDAVLTSI